MRKSVYTREQGIVAEAIQSARRKAGLHQSQLAERLGRDQSIISNIERGQRRVDVIEFYELAKAMEIDPVELFGGLTKKWEDIPE